MEKRQVREAAGERGPTSELTERLPRGHCEYASGTEGAARGTRSKWMDDIAKCSREMNVLQGPEG